MWDTGRRDLRRDEIETRSATKLLNLLLNYLLVNLPGTINSTRYFKKVGSYGTRCIAKLLLNIRTGHLTLVNINSDFTKMQVAKICALGY